MPTRQSRVSVNDIHFSQPLQIADTADDAGKKKCTGAGKSHSAGQRKITKPVCRYSGYRAVNPLSVKRLHGKHRIYRSRLGERIERFGYEASLGIV